MPTRVCTHIAALMFVSLCTTGCLYVPIPYTEGASPPLAGRYQASTGMPIAGARLAVSSHSNDSTCTRAAHRTITDSAGRFVFDRTTVRRGGVLLFPPIEHFVNEYWLCAGVDDSTLRPLYQGWGSRNERAPLDSVVCLQWQWRDRTRNTCSVGREAAVDSGGKWTDGNASGFYRVIRTEEPTLVHDRKRTITRPHAYVQWLEDPGAGPPYIVRATVKLDLGPKVNSLARALVRQRDGRSYVVLSGTQNKLWSDFAPADVYFELGPPGQVMPFTMP